jgi:hypothetical protein
LAVGSEDESEGIDVGYRLTPGFLNGVGDLALSSEFSYPCIAVSSRKFDVRCAAVRSQRDDGWPNSKDAANLRQGSWTSDFGYVEGTVPCLILW